MSTEQNLSKSSKLTDIPLSGDQLTEKSQQDDKLAGKTNSLKRFFKMPSKRGIDVVSTDMPVTHDDGENPDGSKQKEKGLNMRRFHLRLGGTQKRGDSPTDFEAGSSSTVTGSTTTTDGTNKPGLKSSLSNYFNSVFKRGHSVKKRKNQNAPMDDDEEDADETELRDEVHTLAISEEQEQTKST